MNVRQFLNSIILYIIVMAAFITSGFVFALLVGLAWLIVNLTISFIIGYNEGKKKMEETK